MSESGYPTARGVAQRVHAHLALQADAQAGQGRQSAPAPEAAVIQAIVDAAFWASLRREEGRSPRLSLAFLGPDRARLAVTFERALPLSAHPLTRVAPAVERPGIHLGVWREGGELCVWGATRNLPPLCFVVEVIAPGLLVIKQSPADDAGKFVNLAVIQGDEIKIVDQLAAKVPDCPSLLKSLIGFDLQHTPADSTNGLIQLAISMRAHGHGGSLLVVPSNTNEWRHSIVQPIAYEVSPIFSGLADLMQADDVVRAERWWQDSIRRAVDAIGGLTAVDGATILTDRYELLAFGAKIIRRSGSPQVTRVVVTEPIEGSTADIVDPAQLGGTRHLSAAQFEQDQRDAIALVASQDGGFTVFAWSPCEEMVHGHRIETLLL
jgi:hypothetical protein